MAIISVMTDAGETLRTQDVANGTSSQVTRIEADMGFVATAALAQALTDVVTPFVPVRETTNPQGKALANDPVAQFRYLDADAVDYAIKGFGIFAGATMTHYICDDGGATIYPKTAGLILDVVLYITARSGDQATFTFSDDLAAPVATALVPGLVRLATDANVANPPANARALTTDNVDAVLAEVPAAATTPDASTTVGGKVELATAAEVLSALQGNNPGNAIEDNVPTLQTLYDRRGVMYSPPATTTISGNVDLATSTELGSALGGNNPPSAIEDNVPTLQALYDRRGDFGSPDATTAAKGKVELATSAEVRATLGGADPASGIEGNVVTLQAFFDSIKAYEEGSLPAAIPPDGTIEIVHEA